MSSIKVSFYSLKSERSSRLQVIRFERRDDTN